MARFGGRKREDLKSRFDKKWSPEPNTGCWLWTHSVNPSGYGTIGVRQENDKIITKAAHRISYELFKGRIGKNEVLHKCDTPCCVNPEHLFLGNHSENMQDASKKKRFNTAGEKNGRAKIREIDVKIIRLSNKTCKELAKVYNLHATTIARIKRGKLWAC